VATALRILRGDSKTFPLTLTEPFSTTPFNPTGWTLISTFKADYDLPDASASIQKVSTVGGFTIISAGTGRVDLSLVPADTVALDPNVRYVFDVQAQNVSTGEVKTVCLGTLRVSADVTLGTTISISTTVVTPAATVGTTWVSMPANGGASGSAGQKAYSAGVIAEYIGLGGDLNWIFYDAFERT